MKRGGIGKERAPEGQEPRKVRGLWDGLTTGPQVHRLAIRVLPQHFWGEVSRRSCKPCSADTQTSKRTHRGGHVRGMRLPWRERTHSPSQEWLKGRKFLPSKAAKPLDQGGQVHRVPVAPRSPLQSLRQKSSVSPSHGVLLSVIHC